MRKDGLYIFPKKILYTHFIYLMYLIIVGLFFELYANITASKYLNLVYYRLINN